MPKIVSEQEREMMRQQIMAAAAEEFARVGFEPAKTETISERAGIGKGTIYLYFESKQDLFRAMLKEIAAEQLATLQTALSKIDRTDEFMVLSTLFSTFNQLVREQPDSFRIFISSLYGVNRQFKEEAANLRLDFLTLIENLLIGFKVPGQPDTQVTHLALLILNACETLALQAQSLGFAPDFVEQHQSQLVKVLWAGLKAISEERTT